MQLTYRSIYEKLIEKGQLIEFLELNECPLKENMIKDICEDLKGYISSTKRFNLLRNYVREPESNLVLDEFDFIEDPGGGYKQFEYNDELLSTLLKEDPERIWTWVEVDGKSYVTSGYHYVNRLGYFVSKIPFNGNLEIRW